VKRSTALPEVSRKSRGVEVRVLQAVEALVEAAAGLAQIAGGRRAVAVAVAENQGVDVARRPHVLANGGEGFGAGGGILRGSPLLQ